MMSRQHSDRDDGQCSAEPASQHEHPRTGDPAPSLSIYFSELRRSPLLTAAEEVALARQVEAGSAAREELTGIDDADARAALESIVRLGDAAYHKLVESNLRLVVSVARRFTGRGVDLVDLLQEGNLGLYHAVGKYDWRRGTRFSTYATWWIRQAIHRSLNNHGRLIRLPVHLAEQIARAQHALQKLEQEFGRVPTLAEQRERLDPTARKVAALSGVIERPISMDAPVSDDVNLADILADVSAEDPAEIVSRTLVASDLDDALSTTLKPREAQILRLRYGLGDAGESSLVDIGAMLGMSRERARQIEVAALSKLRRSAVVQRQFGLGAS